MRTTQCVYVLIFLTLPFVSSCFRNEFMFAPLSAVSVEPFPRKRLVFPRFPVTISSSEE